MWNLKNNISKQNRNRLRGTKNRLMGADGRGVGGLCEKGEGIERYRLVVTEQSWDAMHTIGNIAKNTVITMHGARWALEVSKANTL